MAAEPTYVIIGASLAGAKAAETLREEGFGGGVILIGAEQERPYERPPLSKGLLLGKDEKSSIYVHEPDWYGQHQVDLRLGETVTGIDRAARQVTLAGWQSGFSLAYPDAYVVVHACGIGIEQLRLFPVSDLGRYELSTDPLAPGAMRWELWPGRQELGYNDLARLLVVP